MHGAVEVEGAADRSWVWSNQVDVDLFTVFRVPVLAGRGFVEADADRGSNAVVVDRVFADEGLGGGDVLGRRIRQVAVRGDGGEEAGPWLEVVGVVPAFTVPPAFEDASPKFYRPMDLAAAPSAVQLAVRMRRGAAPAEFASRLREITAIVNPAFRLDEVWSAADAERQRREGLLLVALVVVAVTGSVLLLSGAGIYAMMSFIVARRRREIGIRSALGAAPRRLIAGIFARAGAQLAGGMVAGLVLAAVPAGRLPSGQGMLLAVVVAAIAVAVGLLGAVGPARRALAVQPAEALREE